MKSIWKYCTSILIFIYFSWYYPFIFKFSASLYRYLHIFIAYHKRYHPSLFLRHIWSPQSPGPATDTSVWTLQCGIISFCMLLTLIHWDPARDRLEALHKIRIKISAKGKPFFSGRMSSTAGYMAGLLFEKLQGIITFGCKVIGYTLLS